VKEGPSGERGAGRGLRGLDEDALTARFRRLAGGGNAVVRLGIGDDAAVLSAPAGGELVWTVEALEEDVDFKREWLTLEELGARAVAVTLSDLAAMAARPLAVLLALGSAAAAPAGELLDLFRGAAAAAARLGAPVAGGDLTRRASGVGLSVTALGTVTAGLALTRSGARPGDEIWVTGRPGLAARGLALLERLGRVAAECQDPRAVSRWMRPDPRLREAAWLRERGAARAAIDLSDGLARDLARLCGASGVGARVDLASLAVAAGPAPHADERQILAGGEDFELLLAAPPGSLAAMADEFATTFGVPLTRVGAIVPGSGVSLRAPDGAERPLPPEGWDHVRPEPDAKE
jgi:thiamine-monophosphate kinase